MKTDSGVALIAVLAGLMVLSAVALALAVSVQTEARLESVDFDAIQAEELAKSGQEFAAFLEARGLSANSNLVAGLPFEAITPGVHYRAQTAAGAVDIYYEADNGKINPRTAPAELVANFFTLWTGDVAKAQIVADSVADWSDPDDEPRPNGAEASYYAGFHIAPRNAALGIADLAFVRGMNLNDFQVQTIGTERGLSVRRSLNAYLTDAPVGAAVNVNFAPELVLRSVPGLNSSQVDLVMRLRSTRPFRDMDALQSQTGIAADSPAWKYLTTARSAPAVSTVAKLKSSRLTRSERRITYSFSTFDFAAGTFEAKSALGRIERTVADLP